MTNILPFLLLLTVATAQPLVTGILTQETPNFLIDSWHVVQSSNLDQCCIPYDLISFSESPNGEINLSASNWVGRMCEPNSLRPYLTLTLPIKPESNFKVLSGASLVTSKMIKIDIKDLNADSAHTNRTQKVQFNLQLDFKDVSTSGGQCTVTLSRYTTYYIPELKGKPYINGLEQVEQCPKDKHLLNGPICVRQCPDNLPFVDENVCVSECPGSKHFLQESVFCVKKCSPNLPCKSLCPTTMPLIDNDVCVGKCPPNKLFIQESFFCVEKCSLGLPCDSLCPADKPLIYKQTCVSQCPENIPFLQDSIFCVDTCPSEDCELLCPFDKPYYHKNTCVAQCPSLVNGNYCRDNCPRYKPIIEGNTCKDSCPPDRPYLNQSTCVRTCPKSSPLISTQTIYTKNSTIDIPCCLERCLKNKPYKYKNKCVEGCPKEAPINREFTCLPEKPDIVSNFIQTSQVVEETFVPTAVVTVQMLRPGSSSVASGLLLFKMIQYVRYLNINFPSKVSEHFQKVNSDTGSYNFIPNLPNSFLKEKSLQFQANPRFARYDLNGLFIINFFSGITTFLCVIIIASLLTSLINKLKLSKPRYIRWREKANLFLKWNLPFLFILSNVDNLSTFALIEYQSLPIKRELIITAASLIFNVICAAGFLILLLYLIKALYSVRKTEEDFFRKGETFTYKLIRNLFKDLKKDRFIQELLLVIVSIRIILHDTIILIWDSPFYQCLALCLLNVLMVAYILKFKPHKYRSGNVELFGYELIIFAVNVCCAYLSILSVLEQEEADKTGEVIFFCNFLIKTFAMVMIGWKFLVQIGEGINSLLNKKQEPASVIEPLSQKESAVL